MVFDEVAIVLFRGSIGGRDHGGDALYEDCEVTFGVMREAHLGSAACEARLDARSHGGDDELAVPEEASDRGDDRSAVGCSDSERNGEEAFELLDKLVGGERLRRDLERTSEKRTRRFGAAPNDVIELG